MATIQSIIDRITYITKDPDHVRWTLPEIALWLNNAKDQIASIHPRSSAEYVTLTLGEGHRQDLRVIDPTKRWIRLFEILANVEEHKDGPDTPTGPTIRMISRQALDWAFRNWRASRSLATSVQEYALDERSPFTFDVVPAVQAGTKVYALASAYPPPCMILNSSGTALVDANEKFPLADGYDIPAVDYVLFRLFSKDANDPANAQRAATHLQAFQLAMRVEIIDAAPQQ